MRSAKIFFKKQEAGILTQHDDGSFYFQYHDHWLSDNTKQSISLTLPKSERVFHSKFLFPNFFNILPEGSNKQLVCQANRIDHDDYFSLLLTTAKYDSIGAVTVEKMENK